MLGPYLADLSSKEKDMIGNSVPRLTRPIMPSGKGSYHAQTLKFDLENVREESRRFKNKLDDQCHAALALIELKYEDRQIQVEQTTDGKNSINLQVNGNTPVKNKGDDCAQCAMCAAIVIKDCK